MQKEQNANNIQSIQVLRGIAAFLVLLCHSVNGEPFRPGQTLVNLCSPLWCGVQIFFIISGFIIPYSMYVNNYEVKDIGKFFAKRLTRIEPPYIVSIGLMLLLYYANTITPWYKGTGYQVDWWNVLGHLGYLNAYTGKPWLNWAYWTLAVEFQYYLILTLTYPLLTNKNKSIMFLSVLGLLAFTFVRIPGFTAPYTPFQILKDQNSAEQIIPYLPFFLMGIVLFLFKVEKITKAEFWGLMLITCLASAYRTGPVLVAISAVTLACIYYVKRVPGTLIFLGTISYSLYLTHGAILARTRIIGMHYLHLNVYVAWAISIVAAVLFACGYYYLIEKPFVRLSKKISFRQKAKAELQPEPQPAPLVLEAEQAETA